MSRVAAAKRNPDVTPMSATSNTSSSRLESGAQIANDNQNVRVVSQTRVEVASQSTDGKFYTVEFDSDGEAECTCMDHQIRGTTCKHIYAACDELHIFDLAADTRGDN